MDIEISTSDPDNVDPARVAAALQRANFFVLTVTVNEDTDGAWVYDPEADILCERHGGPWGMDATCARCTYPTGAPRPLDQPGEFPERDTTNHVHIPIPVAQGVVCSVCGKDL